MVKASSKTFKSKLLKFFDEFSLAGKGLLLATREKKFWLPFLVSFVVFGILLNLLSNGFSSFKLIFAGTFDGALKILWTAFLNIFGIGKNFLDFLLNFSLILLQSTLISLAVFVGSSNRAEKRRKNIKKSGEKSEKSDSAGLESSALVAGLVVLGSGCPTCGTTLLAPVLGAILSGASGSVALAGKLSLVFNLAAFLLGIFVFKKLGFMTYAIIKSEQYMEKKKPNEKVS